MITNSKISNFQEVLCAEHACLNDRRRANGQTDIRKFQSDLPPDVQPTYETVGLALSGGGVRSAAMSLGVLQSLDNFGVLEKVDYLSTVSGGGYIGCSLSATMTLSDGRFAFADAKAVAQLRDRSNYLLPPGKSGQAIAIILRGLVANFSMVLAVLLLFAAGTIILHPKRSLLPAGSASLLSASSLPGNFGAFFITILQAHFGVLICFGSFVFLFFLLWAFNLIRLRSPSGKDLMPVLASLALIGVGVVFFFELQPFLIAGMFDRPMKTVPAILAASIIYLAFFAVPISLLVAFFRRPLGQLLVRASDTTDFAPLILGLPGRLALWLACIALPLLIWITYLYLSYWGIANVGGGKRVFRIHPVGYSRRPETKIGFCATMTVIVCPYL
jgi:hypothetical protein